MDDDGYDYALAGEDKILELMYRWDVEAGDAHSSFVEENRGMAARMRRMESFQKKESLLVTQLNNENPS